MESTENAVTRDVLSVAIVKEMERMLNETHNIDMSQMMHFLENRLKAGLDEPLFPSRFDLGVPDEINSDDIDLSLIDAYFDNIASISSEAIERGGNLKQRIAQTFTQDDINNGIAIAKQLKTSLIEYISNIYFLHKKEYDNALIEIKKFEKEFNENKILCSKKYKIPDIKEMENRIKICQYHHKYYVAYAKKCKHGMKNVLENHLDFIESIFRGV